MLVCIRVCIFVCGMHLCLALCLCVYAVIGPCGPRIVDVLTVPCTWKHHTRGRPILTLW